MTLVLNALDGNARFFSKRLVHSLALDRCHKGKIARPKITLSLWQTHERHQSLQDSYGLGFAGLGSMAITFRVIGLAIVLQSGHHLAIDRGLGDWTTSEGR